VILTLVEDHPVGVVHPALQWREMIVWPKKIVLYSHICTPIMGLKPIGNNGSLPEQKTILRDV
jgi:hypothetical protein